jgi:hypothetical protein
LLEYYAEHDDKPDIITWANMAGVEVGDLLAITTNAIGVTRDQVEIIIRHRLARDLIHFGNEASARAFKREDPYAILADLDAMVSTATANDGIEPQSQSIWSTRENEPEAAEWIVPGMMKRDWRCIVTGAEGTGKGVLLRCMAIATAFGYHPLTHQPCVPRKTLLVDLENPVSAILETGWPLANTLDKRAIKEGREDYDREAFKLWHRPGGIDIRDRRDQAALVREITAHKPDMLCIGPYYKLTRARRGETFEDAAMGALEVLDKLRIKYGFALMIEAHSAKATGGGKRALTPMGSVYLTAWPEIGKGLEEDEEAVAVKTLNVKNFRNSRLEEFWPQRIERHPQYIIRGFWDFNRPDF